VLGRVALGAGFLLLQMGTAAAICDFCNPTIRLNQKVADCFVEQLPTELSRLEGEGRGFVLVDLTHCVENKSRGLPQAGAVRVTDVDTSFVADEPMLRCINDELRQRVGSMDPMVQLDMTKCQ
jgi:hypothetical protein